FAAAASGLFVLWQWAKQYGHFRRDQGFNKYIQRVTRIEEQAVQLEQDPPAGPAPLLALREDLFRLKTEALNRFAEGELAGKELLTSFLAQANDTRDYLMRLIHQQENRPREPAAVDGGPRVPR